MIFDIVYFLHCCWYTFSHWQNGTVPISDMDHTPCPDRIDIKPDWQLVSQQIILKIWKFLYFCVHVLLSEQVHQSIWENLISTLVSLISYCFSSYPIWWFILRLAGHGLFFVAEIVGFVVAEIVGFLLLCAKSAAALAAGSTAFFENCWSIWLNFANSHRSSPLSPLPGVTCIWYGLLHCCIGMQTNAIDRSSHTLTFDLILTFDLKLCIVYVVKLHIKAMT